jgi:phage terminase large subunit GpA-like protein
MNLNRHFSAFTPRPHTRHLIWCMRNSRDKDGRPYSHEDYSHHGNPGGPLDAMDDPSVRRVVLQWGTRLGKTHIGQCCAQKKADEEPGDMMFVSSVEKLAKECIERTEKMCRHSPVMRQKLLPENEQRDDLLRFTDCVMFVGWSQSVSTIADKECEFGHAGEVSKWIQKGVKSKKAEEADPLNLFLDRFKNRPHHKVILEGSPTNKGTCRIEARRLRSTNCRFEVPCPHCSRYQVLEFDQIKWSKLANGRSDTELARKTAYYECRHCKKQILDYHRPIMFRAGVWCPEGCRVKDRQAKKVIEAFYRSLEQAAGGDGQTLKPAYEWKGWKKASWIEGEPARDGPDAGYHLSSLYALSLTWGDIAAEFLSCLGKAQSLRNFKTGWLANTWSLEQRETTAEQLGKRLISDRWRHLEVPADCVLITAAADKQLDHYKYVIEAWATGQRPHVIDYGRADAKEDVIGAFNRSFRRGDGQQLRIRLALVDRGFRPKEVEDLCRLLIKAGVPTIQCHGSTTSLKTSFRKKRMGDDTATPGALAVEVDTQTTQDWIEQQLYDIDRGADGSLSIYQAAFEHHEEFLEELLNQRPELSSGGDRESWNKKDPSIGDDFRDGVRYNGAAYLVLTKGKDLPPPKAPDSSSRRPFPGKRKATSPIERPGGWLNVPR